MTCDLRLLDPIRRPVSTAVSTSRGAGPTPWDSMHSIALYLTLVLTEGERLRPTPQGWLVEPSSEQVNVFTVLEWTGLGIISVVGVSWLVVMWRRAPRPVRAAR
jgi:hypothetical protein